ncbi:DUF6907 domain-containing protein [Streptomyces formicae]
MSTLAHSIEAATAPTAAAEPRLRPALVNGQRCAVYCPSWCVTDHVAENERHLVDVTHEGEAVDLMVPRQGGALQMLASARVLMSDRRGLGDDPMVTVDFGDVMSLYLSPSETLAAADRVAAFEGQLRELARTASSPA